MSAKTSREICPEITDTSSVLFEVWYRKREREKKRKWWEREHLSVTAFTLKTSLFTPLIIDLSNKSNPVSHPSTINPSNDATLMVTTAVHTKAAHQNRQLLIWWVELSVTPCKESRSDRYSWDRKKKRASERVAVITQFICKWWTMRSSLLPEFVQGDQRGDSYCR